ncbi:MAG: divalent metal cation transporter [Thermoguttaceae bacterium]|nr:divalent metal cation transporter [Thermoguttaceae bacterium]MDW8036814.1 divalent metal cation transporter [Thermoguttaceae bacterium]
MSENQQLQKATKTAAELPEADKGLPMTQKWDPATLEREVAELQLLETQPFFRRAIGYLKRTGPALLQSAMTLGAGSATASVVAGASFGYKLLWVQPLAMFLGICMLAALGNVVLTTGERPYRAVGRELSRLLAFLWALGTIIASVIWHFPQYGLAAAAARDLATMAGASSQIEFLEVRENEQEVKYYTRTDAATAELVRQHLPDQQAYILANRTPEQWSELQQQLDGKKTSRQFTLFTSSGLAISWFIGLLILSINVSVVWSYGSSPKGIKLYEWFLRGIIGLMILLFAVVVAGNAGKIQWVELVKGFIGWYGIPQPDNPKHVTLVLGMLGAAVGINMTFLYPYSLLAKGWGPAHKTLSRWDLAMSMFLPFTLVTSLIMLGMTIGGVYTGQDVLRETIQPLDAAQALGNVLENLLGKYSGRIIFDLGLIAMTCSAISAHMVVCGFTMCEMLGLRYTKGRFRLFALTPSIGILGVVTKLPFWFPVVASGICFAMLPIAYVIFFLLQNKRSYIGDAVGRGWRRWLWNTILLVAIALATTGAIIQIKTRVIDELRKRLFPPAPTASMSQHRVCCYT